MRQHTNGVKTAGEKTAKDDDYIDSCRLYKYEKWVLDGTHGNDGNCRDRKTSLNQNMFIRHIRVVTIN